MTPNEYIAALTKVAQDKQFIQLCNLLDQQADFNQAQAHYKNLRLNIKIYLRPIIKSLVAFEDSFELGKNIPDLNECFRRLNKFKINVFMDDPENEKKPTLNNLLYTSIFFLKGDEPLHPINSLQPLFTFILGKLNDVEMTDQIKTLYFFAKRSNKVQYVNFLEFLGYVFANRQSLKHSVLNELSCAEVVNGLEKMSGLSNENKETITIHENKYKSLIHARYTLSITLRCFKLLMLKQHLNSRQLSILSVVMTQLFSLNPILQKNTPNFLGMFSNDNRRYYLEIDNLKKLVAHCMHATDAERETTWRLLA